MTGRLTEDLFEGNETASSVHDEADSPRIKRRLTTHFPPTLLEEHAEDSDRSQPGRLADSEASARL